MKLYRGIGTILLTAVFFAMIGCNTIKGVGKDLEKAGESIQKSADHQKKD